MKNLTVGTRFGRLILRQRVRRGAKVSLSIRMQWVCDCDCGRRLTIPQWYLVRPKQPRTNCGECPDLIPLKTKYKTEYSIWYMINVRTTDPRHKHYNIYGGRGIRCCPEWSWDAEDNLGFERFLEHIGPRTSLQHTCDRFPDPDGNYQPGNVRWATAKQQAANKSKLSKHQFPANLLPTKNTAEQHKDERAQTAKETNNDTDTADTADTQHARAFFHSTRG